MNIFPLDITPKLSAEFHCDKHMKMILEGTQLLCNVFYNSNKSKIVDSIPYKVTHYNHPCSIWTRQSLANFNWLFELAYYLNEEYTFRYNKVHACFKHLDFFLNNVKYIQFKTIGLTPHVMCMPDEYKTDNFIEAYRTYYIKEKVSFAKWTKRSVPYWFKITEKVLDNSSVLC